MALNQRTPLQSAALRKASLLEHHKMLWAEHLKWRKKQKKGAA